MIFFLSDFNVSNYARTLGAKDKQKRKSNLLRNVAIGAGGLALAGGLGYLALKGKGVKSTSTSTPISNTTSNVTKNVQTGTSYVGAKTKSNKVEIKPEAIKVEQKPKQYKETVRKNYTKDELINRGNLAARYDSDPLYIKENLGLYGKATKKQRNSLRIEQRRNVLAGKLNTSNDSYLRRVGRDKTVDPIYEKRYRKDRQNIAKQIKSLNKSFINSDYNKYHNYVNL